MLVHILSAGKHETKQTRKVIDERLGLADRTPATSSSLIDVMYQMGCRRVSMLDLHKNGRPASDRIQVNIWHPSAKMYQRLVDLPASRDLRAVQLLLGP